MRIDATAEDLPDVSGVQVGPRGEIAIYVSHDKHVRFYDSTGHRLGVFGRRGRGPGEFEGYSSWGWIADTLWIYDWSQKRVTYIAPTLKLARTEVIDHLNQTRSSAKQDLGRITMFTPGAIASGRYLGSAKVTGGRAANGEDSVVSRVLSVPIRGERDRPELNAVALAEEQLLSSVSVTYRSSTMTSMVVVPFAFRPRTEFSPDGSRFAVLTPDTATTPRDYTITLFSQRGDTLFTRKYKNAGERIPARVADSALTARIGGPNRRAAEASSTLKALAQKRMPSVYPAVGEAPGGLVLGRDGSVWIQTWQTTRGSSAIAVDRRGNPLFEVRLPPRTTVQSATATMLWVEQTDADDLTSVVRYRIR
jgi:hypothetical protein